MSSISEEFKDQKINDLLEDYIQLEKQIGVVSQRVISLLEGTEERFDKSVSDGVQRLHSEVETSLNAWNRLISDADERSLQRINEIATLISNVENEGSEYISKLSESIADEKRSIIEEGGRAKESFYREAEKVLSDIKADLKAQASSHRPISKTALIGFSFLGVIILSAAFCSGSYMYLKYKAEQDLHSVLLDTKTLMQFTEKTITNLPTKAQRDNAQKRYLEIVSKPQQE